MPSILIYECYGHGRDLINGNLAFNMIDKLNKGSQTENFSMMQHVYILIIITDHFHEIS